jgi:hypothetical protein
LLDDLQDLHDRSGACMPNLYRHLALAGAQRIAQSFRLSMRLVHRCAAYQHIRGPQIFSAGGTQSIPAAAPAVDVSPAPDLSPALDLSPAPGVSPAPDLAAAPTPVPEPMQLTERPQEEDLDLLARGIARAIAAATAHGRDQPRRR